MCGGAGALGIEGTGGQIITSSAEPIHDDEELLWFSHSKPAALRLAADQRSVTMETVAKIGVGCCVSVGLIAALVSLGFTRHLTRARTSAAFAVAAVALSVIFAAPDFQPVSGVLTAATVMVLTAAGTSYLMAPWMIAEGEKYRRRRRESGR
jgi:hypothetical protein